MLSPLAGDVTPTNGNLYVTGVDKSTLGTVGVSSGKWYFEMTCVSNVATTNNDGVGIGNCGINNSAPDFAFYIYRSGGVKLQNGGANTSYGATFTTNDVIGVAYDADAGTLVFYKNNSSQGTAFTGITGTMLPIVYARGITSTPTLALNFGQQPFIYTPPTGYVALNTYNLPTPTILQGNKYMDATLYTGNASSQTVSNGKFYPDLTWFKCRSAAAYHVLFDSIRGASSALYSNVTNTQDTGWTGQSFTSTGFTVSNAYSSETNYNTQTMVGWQWLAGAGSSSSNTNGTITSTVSVNTTAGFSVVNWTGSTSTSAQTVGHGLGVTPSMVILKNRNLVDNWFVWFSGITSTSQNLYLNTTAALTTQASALWGAGMTPTLCGVRPNSFVNTSSDNVIMYCWAEIAGFSKFTSYTGNGSADGPFIFTGFRPKWLMIKRTDSTQNWIIVDTSRDTYNVANKRLLANSSAAEDTGIPNYVDLLSNGFKCRDSNISYNASGGTYIVMAYAENPFKNSNAR
jgi:hypothetical protein